MKINPNTKRHGKAAAIALWARLEQANIRKYGEPNAVAVTENALAAYLEGYARATQKAKAGFRDILGEIAACSIDCGSIAADLLAQPKEINGPALSAVERSRHARMWLKGATVKGGGSSC